MTVVEVGMLTRRLLINIAVAAVAAAGLPAVAQAQGAALKFEIYKDSKAQFRWRLSHVNGQVLATGGQGYRAKADCERGVKVVQQAGGPSSKSAFEIYEDASKGFRWRLKTSNGRVVAVSSESYRVRGDCEKAIARIKDGAAKAPVEEVKVAPEPTRSP